MADLAYARYDQIVIQARFPVLTMSDKDVPMIEQVPTGFREGRLGQFQLLEFQGKAFDPLQRKAKLGVTQCAAQTGPNPAFIPEPLPMIKMSDEPDHQAGPAGTLIKSPVEVASGMRPTS